MHQSALYGPDVTPSQLQDFYDYKLSASKKALRIFLLVLSVFNALLLLPDLMFIQAFSARVVTFVLRIGYSLGLVGLYLGLGRLQRFSVFAWIATIGEVIAIIIFLYVMHQYDQPDYMIHTLGVMTLTLVIFLFPNRWPSMLAVAIFNAAGFLVLSYRDFYGQHPMQYKASLVYIPITILLCAVFAYNAEYHHFREYLAHTQFKRLSAVDPLTHTANRFKLYDDGRRWLDFCRRHGLPLSLVYFDVDGMKAINDRSGHLAGDSVLVHMTRLISSQLRNTDVLARWGGDEFILLLPNIPIEGAVALAERIRTQVEGYPFVKDHPVTCSFGVVEMQEDSSLESMIQAADDLLYTSKRQGKNTVHWRGSDSRDAT